MHKKKSKPSSKSGFFPVPEPRLVVGSATQTSAPAVRTTYLFCRCWSSSCLCSRLLVSLSSVSSLWRWRYCASFLVASSSASFSCRFRLRILWVICRARNTDQLQGQRLGFFCCCFMNVKNQRFLQNTFCLTLCCPLVSVKVVNSNAPDFLQLELLVTSAELFMIKICKSSLLLFLHNSDPAADQGSFSRRNQIYSVKINRFKAVLRPK